MRKVISITSNTNGETYKVNEPITEHRADGVVAKIEEYPDGGFKVTSQYGVVEHVGAQYVDPDKTVYAEE